MVQATSLSNDTSMHPLRKRMLEDMGLRGFCAGAKRGYLRAVRHCIQHAKKRPEDITVDDARAFLLHLQKDSASVTTINSMASGLRFYLRVTLNRPFAVERLPDIAQAQTIPNVLSPEEVARVIANAPGLK
ncbi:MAG: site-specific integrase [Parvularculaceae bacterium]